MKRLPFLPLFLIITIALIFFYPVLKGHLPFPGDLLVGNTAPYNSNSYGAYGPGAVPHKAQGPDVIVEMFPWRYFSITSLLSGQIPFWNPHQFSGNPLMANFQSGIFYPVTLVFLTNFNLGWTVFILLTPILAAFFLYLFLRNHNVSTLASLYGGIIFAFSSYMVVWMEYGNIGHTLLWLPLVLLITDKISKESNWKTLLLFEVVLLLSFLAGYIQGYFYIVAVAFFYYLMRNGSLRLISFQKILMFGVLLVLPIILGSFQLLPTLQLFSQSTRGNYSLSQIQNLLNPVWYTITVLAPDFFGNPASRNYWFNGTYIERVSYFGLIPFLLATLAAVSVRKKEVRFFTVLGLVTFLLVTDIFITKYLFLLPIPVLSTTVPTRMLSIFVFAGSVLSAFGLDYLIESKSKRILMPPVIAGAVLVVAIGVMLVERSRGGLEPTYVQVSLRNIILPLGYIGSLLTASLLLLLRGKSLLLQKKKYLAISIILLVTIFDLFYFFHKITPFSPPAYVYPKTPVITYLQNHAGIDRFWGYGSGYIRSNFQSIDGTYSPEGNDPLHIEGYTEFLSTSNDGKVKPLLSRTDANISPGFGTGDLNSNIFRQKVLNVLGVRYLVHKYENSTENFDPDIATFDPKNYSLIWQETPWQIYENLNAAPRAFFTSMYEVVDNKEQLFKRFFDPAFDETKTILLYKNPRIAIASVSGRVNVMEYSGNKVSLAVKTETPSLLFLSDTYYPEWKATIDGKATETLQADHAFRAVVVPEGKHTVQFFYSATMFRLGLLISLVGVGVLGALLLLVQRKKLML